jgi:hypothetical protein
MSDGWRLNLWFDRQVTFWGSSAPGPGDLAMHARRHALLLVTLVACGPGGPDMDSQDTQGTLGGSESTMSPTSGFDPSVSSDPSDPTTPTVPTSATTPTSAAEPTSMSDPTNTVDPTTPTTMSDPTVATVTASPTLPTFPTSETEGSFSDSDVSSSFDVSTTTPVTSETEFIFIIEPDAPSTECSTFLEDCPPGQKCMPFADGSASWNNLKCVQIVDFANAPGDPCTVEDSGVSGIDDCQLHAMCFNVDADTLQGVCVAMCDGSPVNPVCAPSSVCSISNEGVLALCLATCDPLDLQACPVDEVCALNDSAFVCLPDASEAGGQQFDECEFANACDPGHICLSTEFVGPCHAADDGCCTRLCDLTNPQPQCPVQLECLALFEEGQAPPGLEDVGVCVSPQ